MLGLSLFAFAISGCGDDDAKNNDDGGGKGGSGGSGQGGSGLGGQPGAPTSSKALVKFKTGKRLAAEWTRALDIPQSEFCQELGFLNCFNIHQIALGGTDAFFTGIYEPLKDTTATTPLAVDRIALSGCTQRVDADLASPASALVYGGLPIDGSGRLTNVDDPAVTTAIDTLYKRVLARPAKEHETAAHRKLYVDIEASGNSTQPARDWATMSCMTTLTTMEALFY